MTTLQNRISGSIVGGAVGDALGYPVEFSGYNEIIEQYGEKGIVSHHLNNKGVAEISDDTQMTLFTANALLLSPDRPLSVNLTRAYSEWLDTQYPFMDESEYECWLSGIAGLHSRRGPGCTCLSSLEAIRHGLEVNNRSKGCGGIMRVAPIAAFGASRGREIGEMVRVGCLAARLTHQHPLGWLPAGLMVYCIQKTLTHDGPIEKEDFISFVHEGLAYLKNGIQESDGCSYGEKYADDFDILDAGTRLAEELSAKDMTDVEAIGQLGEGWTGEEAWFVSLYCVLRHFDSFEDAVVAAVNHSGDSDSTGSVTGNLIGALKGYNAIPPHFIRNLELRDVIETVAQQLCTGIIAP